jgi:hypothetical protein
VAPDSSHRQLVAGWVGRQYPPLPPGYRSTGSGQLLEAPTGAQYALSVIEIENYAGTTLISLDSLHAPSGDGRRTGTVLAALVIPPVAPGERLQWGSCARSGGSDSTVIAIVDTMATDSFRIIHRAWEAIPARHGFRVLPTAGIACENVGYGE